MKKMLFFLIISMYSYASFGQTPNGFNYQAVARDANGSPIANSTLPIKIGILSDTTNNIYVWEEQHSVKTNSAGLISIVVGTGTRVQGVASFSNIDWSASPLFIRIKITYQGAEKVMGSSKIWSVPYAKASEKAKTADNALMAETAKGVENGSKLLVVSNDDDGIDALFEVKRKDGQTVFAVYPDAVNVYVPRSGAKGAKGGFAIGGFDVNKAEPQDYFRVTPDSVRVYIDPTPPDVKGAKGGFAIGGYGEAKGINDMYFNLTGATSVNTVTESPQILWYPIKKAFLAGSIHIGAIDSVGQNSTALGYRSIAMGDFSQAFGYKARAYGDYSTSIGKNSIAGARSGGVSTASSAFAFGNGAKATGNDSYALGSGSTASGFKSFAYGSASQATNTNALALGNGTVASGINSTAMGYQSQANGELSIAIGSFYTYSYTALPYFSLGKGDISGDTKGDFIIRLPVYTPLFKTISFSRANIANGKYSIAIGNGNLSNNGGMALGSNNDATAFGAVSIGVSNKAVNTNTYAAGYNNLATGYYATAFGNNTYSKSYGSFVIGQYNEVTGDSTKWVSTDPVFVIGNGLSNTDRSNALTLYKNGRAVFLGEHANISLNEKITKTMYIRGIGSISTTSVYGIKSFVNRADAGVNYYYSGYFYDTGVAGTYKGLYADIIDNDYLYTDYINGAAADIAEYYHDTNANTEPGDVVIADIRNKESVIKSDKPYQAGVLGVISTKPLMVLGSDIVADEKTSTTVNGGKATRLALSGRVPVKVCNENGPIQPGDMLTTSSTPGYAMKWTLLDISSAADFNELKRILTENERRRSAVIGKAVEGFSGRGTATISVLISLQ